jgi:hypothetical protein
MTDLGMRQADLAHAEGFTVITDDEIRAVLGGNVYRRFSRSGRPSAGRSVPEY